MAITDYAPQITMALDRLRRDCAPATVSHHKDWKQGVDVVRIGGFEQRIPAGTTPYDVGRSLFELRSRYLAAQEQPKRRRRFRTRQRSIMAGKPRAIGQKVVLWGWP